MNTTILARSPPAGFFVCPKLSNKQGEEHMNDIFENTETMQENEHPRFYTAESVMRGHPDKPVSYTHLDVYKRQPQSLQGHSRACP